MGTVVLTHKLDAHRRYMMGGSEPMQNPKGQAK